jgi:hypothetical protein
MNNPITELPVKDMNPKDAKPRPDAPDYSSGTRFSDMSSTQKWVWIGKLTVCIVTFGMAFPNVMTY